VLVREGMWAEELRDLMGDSVLVKRSWYSLKYNRNMIMAVDGDTDMTIMF